MRNSQLIPGINRGRPQSFTTSPARTVSRRARRALCGPNVLEGANIMKYRLAALMAWMFGTQGPLHAEAAQQPATEAPAGLDTPTLVNNARYQSPSDRNAEPSRDSSP